MNDIILVREWGSDAFHQRVMEAKADGYIARNETYQVTAEMDPETGKLIHLHTIEMGKPHSPEA